ncbi:hypothetical protein U9M48_040874 [Paspalum notatum var. saurae]|uniref:Reverse transcriptase domain-containing protein n=1 Tax=Paspalum notatum var. saurae TaxID=547442 RepID=A0AAQ3UML5_PASNO
MFYDKVSWDFMFECLRMRGFGPQWCSWMKQVVVGGTVSVKSNDMLVTIFKGDLLSPILFNFVADCLAQMIINSQKSNLICGLTEHLIPGGVCILQYANDTILCLKNDKEKVRNLKILLYVYEMMFGLKINFSKSEVILVNGGPDLEQEYTDLFNCQVGVFPIRYLGVPVSPSRLHSVDWIPLEEKNS